MLKTRTHFERSLFAKTVLSLTIMILKELADLDYIGPLKHAKTYGRRDASNYLSQYAFTILKILYIDNSSQNMLIRLTVRMLTEAPLRTHHRASRGL